TTSRSSRAASTSWPDGCRSATASSATRPNVRSAIGKPAIARCDAISNLELQGCARPLGVAPALFPRSAERAVGDGAGQGRVVVAHGCLKSCAGQKVLSLAFAEDAQDMQL